MEKVLEYEIDMTLNDLREFSFSHIKYRGFPLIFGIFSLIMSIFIFLYSVFNLKINSYYSILMPNIIWLIFLVLLPLLINYQAKSHFKNNKFFHDTLIYKIDSEMININSKSFNVDLTWDKIYKVNEYKGIIAFYISKVQAYILPKRYFKNEDELNIIKEYVNYNIPKKRIKYLKK